jgi:hypothetical protein
MDFICEISHSNQVHFDIRVNLETCILDNGLNNAPLSDWSEKTIAFSTFPPTPQIKIMHDCAVKKNSGLFCSQSGHIVNSFGVGYKLE